MSIKTIAIGCDHAGFPYKGSVKELLQSRGINVLDFGTNSTEAADYPDFIHPAAEAVESGQADLGIVFCGSGNGAAMTANKHQGIRAAVCWMPELAAMARLHNDANILALPVRYVSEGQALKMVEAFLDSDFEGGRHARRIGKITCS